MRISLIFFAAVALFMAGCTTVIKVPPTDPAVAGPEPRTIMLSEAASELGWTYETGPGAYDYTMHSPRGDKVIFRIGTDYMNINGGRYQQERDVVEKRGHDLLLPESTFNFVCEHFGRFELVRTPRRDSKVVYDLKPIDHPGASKTKNNTKATSSELKGLTICIDPGHGGSDPGGIGSGIQEKTIVLPVGLALQKLCESAGAKVLMTRIDDSYPDLDKRCDIANSNKVDLFVSIHANISPSDTSVTGFEVFYNKKSKSGALFARALANAMDKATDTPNRGARKDPRGLRVLEKTKMTATLVELGFLSNAEEAHALTKKDYQNKLAKALFEGIVSHWTKNHASVSK
jgi:N-acetylmuramoyl-L-alanine amidase